MNESVRKLKSTKAGGFTLLEVLVALVVLSIGLIGLAGLQSTSLRLNNSAYMRSQATALAYDITDRVRANAAAGTAYSTLSPQEKTACQGGSGTCTASDMAQHDLFTWLGTLSDPEVLPLGTGTICVDSTPETNACDGSGNAYVVRVTWDDNRNGVADVNDPNENIVMSFLP